MFGTAARLQGPRWLGAAVLAGTALAGVTLAGAPRAAAAGAGARQVASLLANLPLRFEANQGQADPRVRYLSRGPGFALYLTPREAALVLDGPAPRRPAGSLPTGGRRRASVLSMSLVGASGSPELEGVEPLASRTNYLVGRDSRHWRTDIPNFSRVRYREVYPGVDLVYYGRQRRLEYDFALSPGADPGRIRLAFRGAESGALDGGGDLLLRVPGGELRQHRPVAFQEIGGRRVSVEAAYRLIGARERRAPLEVAFRVGRYDRRHPLTIDPILSYSTLVGGSNDDYGMGIAVDAASSAYITGYTASYTRPEDPGPATITASPPYPVVPLLAPFPTTLSPLQSDPDLHVGAALDLDVDPTTSPTPFLMTYYDAFVCKLNAGGTGLVYSTYLGGIGDDYGTAIAVDPEGSAYVTGLTRTASFPLERPIQAAAGGGGDAFITKLNPQGNRLVYSTYYGGTGYDVGRGIAADVNGNCTVTGITDSDNLSVFREVQSRRGGGRDQFVVNLNARGSAFNYATYLGGAGNEGGLGPDHGALPYVTHVQAARIVGTDRTFPGAVINNGSQGLGADYGAAVAVDAQGNAYVVGTTESADFRTENAIQAAIGGGTDAFVTKFDPFGRVDRAFGGFSTFLGGTADDGARAVTVDGSGNVYVAGYSASANFPTRSAFQAANGGGQDVFVAKLVPAGSQILFSTYLGGSGDEMAYGVAVDFAANIFVTGFTRSANFPMLFPVQGNLRAGFGEAQDAFVTKLKPQGATLEYSTYLGGFQRDVGTGLATNSIGSAFVTGLTAETFSAGGGPSSFPTTFPSLQRFMRYPTASGFVSAAYGFDFTTGAFTYPLVDSFVTRVANPPQAPSTLEITGVAQTEIAIAWVDNSNNETGFEIERKSAPGDFALVGAVGPDRATFVDTGLTPATTYSYRVRAANLEGTSAYTNQATSTTLPGPPAAPANLVVTTVDQSRLRLDWTDASNNESEFRIERRVAGQQFREVATVAANTAAFTDTGLSDSTTYTYRVRALNLGGSSSYSNEASGATLPVAPDRAPTGLTATVRTSRQIDLAWQDANTNETGFRIERKPAGGVFEVVRVLVGADITAYSDTGLVQQTTYVYRIRAFNITGDGPYSNEASATTLPDPPLAPSDLVAASNGPARVDLTWRDNSTNESEFRVERSTDGSTFSEVAQLPANSTSYADNNLVAGATHYYRVRAAIRVDGNPPQFSFSEYSNVAAQDNRPTPPSDLKAEAVSGTEIALTWKDNSGNETGFKVERSTDGTNFVLVAFVDPATVSYRDQGLTPATPYEYRVRSTNESGDSPPSPPAKATTFPLPPAAPSNLVGRFISGTQIRLDWVDNSGTETAFIVERAIEGSEFVQIAPLGANVTSYVDTGRDPLAIYLYRVKARGRGGDSGYSNTVRVVFRPAPPSGLTATALGSSQVRLDWIDNSNSETGFKIERRTDTSEYAQIDTVGANVTSYLDQRLRGNTTYYYRVRATNSEGDSAYSGEANATTLPDPPKAPVRLTGAFDDTGTVVLLNWVDTSDNETNFVVERSSDTQSFETIVELPAGSQAYQDAGRDATTLYFYRVRARNAGGESAYSNIAVVIFRPSAPAGLTAVVQSDARVRLSWSDTSPTETGYEVERRSGGESYRRIATLPANSSAYLDEGVTGGNTYTYRVRAVNAGGFSDYSNEAEATTPVTLLSVTLRPLAVRGGQSATGTVTLGTPAPAGGVTVTLTSLNTGVATVETSVRIAAGATTGKFGVRTRRGRRGSAAIVASFGGQSRLATLRVRR